MVLTFGFTVTLLPTATGKPPSATVYQVAVVVTGQFAVSVTGVPAQDSVLFAATFVAGGGAAKFTLAKILAGTKVITIFPLVAAVKPVALAAIVTVPAVLNCKSLNVATPATADLEVVPESTPGPVALVMVMLPV